MEHLAHMFRSVVAEHGSRPATRIRQGEQWVVQTYAELDQKIRRTARALVAAGVEPGDRVSIFAHNCPEWTQVDFACMTIGAIPTPIYATSTPEQIKHIINDSGARLIFASGESEASRCLDVLDEMPSVLQVVSFDEIQLDGTSTLSAFDATGDGPARRQELEAEVERRMAEVVGPDDLCAIIYTSGTTGAPKGVMLRHRNLIAQNHALSLYLPVTPEDHSLCFLPLSHALERGFSMFTISRGCMNTYVRDAKQVADLLVLAKPTMLASVVITMACFGVFAGIVRHFGIQLVP